MSNLFKSALSAARHAWFLQRKKRLRQRILRDYGQSSDKEIQEVMAFIQRHPEIELPVGMRPPYEWADEYRPQNVQVGSDGKTGLPYVTFCGHRIFFPRDSTVESVQSAVSIGLMEQDSRSPHRYVGDGFNVDDGDIGVFIGASNGLFCASLIERLSKAYLFEPDSMWHESLCCTFASWGDKAEILQMAAGSETTASQTSLDDFFKNRPFPNYIQADVEGAELSVLKGAQSILQHSSKLRLSFCTYHNRPDFYRFESMLRSAGYEISHSPGYYFIGVRMPYFRRGILYASRFSKSAL
jgi:Methyltransferase FkbM domain